MPSQGMGYERAEVFKQSMKGLALSFLSVRHKLCAVYARVIFHEVTD